MALMRWDGYAVQPTPGKTSSISSTRPTKSTVLPGVIVASCSRGQGCSLGTHTVRRRRSRGMLSGPAMGYVAFVDHMHGYVRRLTDR